MANDFLPFSTSGTANVYTNAEYIADADTTNGNQPGIAKSKLVNKALRQCSIISTVVAQYIADITGTNAVDDGTTATLLTNLKSATNVATNTHSATVKTTPVDADEFAITDSASSFGLKKLTWANMKTTLGALFAPLVSPAFTGTPTAPTATVGTNTTQLATTAFVNASFVGVGLGVGQTWQTVTRTSGVTYTNTTGRTIALSFYTTNITVNLDFTIVVGGLLIQKVDNGSGYVDMKAMFAIIPKNTTYIITSPATFVCTELR